MGLSSAFDIGRTALAAYQAALKAVGNNIANANTPGYARTTARLSAVPGTLLPAGQLGGGVRLGPLQRSVSEALQARLRTALSDRESASAERANLGRIETIFDALGDQNLGSGLSAFFNSLSELQNDPETLASRGIVVNSAAALAEQIRSVREGLVGMRDDLNREIELSAQRADQLATRIAQINTEITTAEAGTSGQATALRNERDVLLSELSELFQITVRDQPSGAMNVYIGSNALVQFGESFGLNAVNEFNADGLKTTVVRLGVNNAVVTPRSGKVEGLINSRDTHTDGPLARLDTLARALIREVNRIHAGGQGLEGFNNLTGTYAVSDPSLALSAADNGIAFPPESGSFFIDVKDEATGTVVRHQINIDLDGIGADTTLNDVVNDINTNVANVSATILPDGRLQLAAADGHSFTFADDTSGFLGAAGLNTLFTGTGALDIDVNGLIANNPRLLAASQSGLPGDGSNATALVGLQNGSVASLGNVSIDEFYRATVSDVAVRSSAAQSAMDAGNIIFDALTAQRESISGVNLDEEAINMLTLQRAFEGAARYMNVVDEMLQTLLGLVR